MTMTNFVNGFDPHTGLVECADPMYFVIDSVGCKETIPTTDQRQAINEWSQLKRQYPGNRFRLVFANPNAYPNDLTEKAIRMGYRS